MRNTALAANVIDLEAFRQRKARPTQETSGAMPMMPSPMFVPVWVCWVPVWAPVMP